MSGSVDRLSAEDRAHILVPTPLGDLRDAALTPPRFLIDPILPRGVPTMLGAHGGAGKSMLALVIAAHVAEGKPWAGYPIAQGRTLFVSMEDSVETVRYRLHRACLTYGLDLDQVARNLTLLDGTRDDCALAHEISLDGIRTLAMTAAWEEIEDAAPGHDLVIVDNASDAFAGNENERRQVRQFMRGLGRLAHENDSAVLLLAHIDKQSAKFGANGNSYSGSSAWHNSSRSRLALTPTRAGGVDLVHEKWNYSKQAPPTHLDWSPEYGVLVPVTEGMSDRIDQADHDRAQILACIHQTIDSGADVPTAHTGPANTFTALRHRPGFPAWATQAGGKDRFWSAVNQLLASKELIAAEYTNANRKTRQRLELRQSGAPFNPRTPSARTGATGAPVPPNAPIAPIAGTGATGATGADTPAEDYRRAKGE